MFIIELWKKLHEVGVNDRICRGVDVSSFFCPFKGIFRGQKYDSSVPNKKKFKRDFKREQ